MSFLSEIPRHHSSFMRTWQTGHVTFGTSLTDKVKIDSMQSCSVPHSSLTRWYRNMMFFLGIEVPIDHIHNLHFMHFAAGF